MRRDPFDDLTDRMQNIFEEFQDMGRDLTGLSGVPVDVHKDDGEIIVKADLPGINKENLSLKADKDTLEIAAEGSEEVEEENEKYFRRERARRTYRRTVPWPTTVDPESITAEYSDGVLTVTAEIEEEDDSREIDIE